MDNPITIANSKLFIQRRTNEKLVSPPIDGAGAYLPTKTNARSTVYGLVSIYNSAYELLWLPLDLY